jgi:hypothetical protein
MLSLYACFLLLQAFGGLTKEEEPLPSDFLLHQMLVNENVHSKLNLKEVLLGEADYPFNPISPILNIQN